MQVATLIARHRHHPVIPDHRLRETNIGDMGGLTKDVALSRFPDACFQTSNPNYDFRLINGESREEVVERQLACLKDICLALGEEDGPSRPNIVIVGHGTALRNLREHYGFTDRLHEQGSYQFLDISLE